MAYCFQSFRLQSRTHFFSRITDTANQTYADCSKLKIGFLEICPGLHANAKIAILAKNRKNRKHRKSVAIFAILTIFAKIANNRKNRKNSQKLEKTRPSNLLRFLRF